MIKKDCDTMRLIAEFSQDQEALHFQLFLRKENIETIYEPASPSATLARIWVVDEDCLEKAHEYYSRWKKGEITYTITTKDPKVKQPKKPLRESKKGIDQTMLVRGPKLLLTKVIIMLCTLLFLISNFQTQQVEKKLGPIGAKYPFAPLQKQLLFDYPAYFEQLERFLIQNSIREATDFNQLSYQEKMDWHRIQSTPVWQGVMSFLSKGSLQKVKDFPSANVLIKIQEGQYWRLVTPIFLHGSFLHILFNMSWLFMLGVQIEVRIGFVRYLLLSLMLAIFSNVAQYVMTGPVFIGYSGVITGMFGFIWSRQNVAPKEGYPLQKKVITAMAGFVIAMCVLEMIAVILHLSADTSVDIAVANTAHIAGGLLGIVLGKTSLFARKLRRA